MRKLMNFFGLIALVAITCATFVACGDDDDKKVEEPYIEVNPTSLQFAWNGTEQSVAVKSNINWIVASNPTWVKFSPSSATGESVLTISVEPNESKDSRTGVLMIQGGGIIMTISIEQAGNDGKEPEPEPDPEQADYEKFYGSWVSTTHHFEYLELKSDGTAIYEWYINDKLAGYSVPNKGIWATGKYILKGTELIISLTSSRVDEEMEGSDLDYYIEEEEMYFYDVTCDGRRLRLKGPYDFEEDVEQTFVKVENYTPMSYGKDVTGTANGHAYVDLGLSVKWAAGNLGATAPQDYGQTYAFGESGTKNDPAVKTWGGDWRLPTKAEAQELLNKCKVTPIYKKKDDGLIGIIVKGPNGNSIYLPYNFNGVGLSYMVGEKYNSSRIYGLWWNGGMELTDLTASYKRMVRPVISITDTQRDLTAPDYVPGTLIGAWKTNYENYNMMVFYADGTHIEITYESGKYYVFESTYTYNAGAQAVTFKRKSDGKTDVLTVLEVNENSLKLAYNGSALAPYTRYTGTLSSVINKLNNNGEYEGY